MTQMQDMRSPNPFDAGGFVWSAADAIIAADAQGKIVFWNPAAGRIFGFTAEEALGQTLDLIIPARFRARHWEGFRRVMESGESQYQSEVLRVPALHRHGRPLSIAFTVTLLGARDAGEPVIVAIVRDDTVRWNEERELRRRLSELEKGDR